MKPAKRGSAFRAARLSDSELAKASKRASVRALFRVVAGPPGCPEYMTEVLDGERLASYGVDTGRRAP